MCDINVFVRHDGHEQMVMENVDVVEDRGGRFHLTNIFGEEKDVAGKMVVFNNSQKRMVFEAL
ncbi:MAG: CooT family nickel-binding protein [Desulfobacterales bacterium]|jgi:predicted RNA-binding protein|nr:CooT family nickel-binding protein [Desulfobacterales bacterium]MDZ7597105.1 CooT family nickel-binding protein [Desulfobacterales bacterium]